ncbi:hypothetical protein ARMSODRAFT_190842 [Armillaria solidipes]|uniref:Uncharacterized protein n=1 Tax=Armillaria solidipes TaxID=1076256 RepID=A0A2H3C0C8_9AGAR|nr:hypothetical protein ARMSODRAFT_190842 [Armillaria solidipes]
MDCMSRYSKIPCQRVWYLPFICPSIRRSLCQPSTCGDIVFTGTLICAAMDPTIAGCLFWICLQSPFPLTRKLCIVATHQRWRRTTVVPENPSGYDWLQEHVECRDGCHTLTGWAEPFFLTGFPHVDLTE